MVRSPSVALSPPWGIHPRQVGVRTPSCERCSPPLAAFPKRGPRRLTCWAGGAAWGTGPRRCRPPSCARKWRPQNAGRHAAPRSWAPCGRARSARNAGRGVAGDNEPSAPTLAVAAAALPADLADRAGVATPAAIVLVFLQVRARPRLLAEGGAVGRAAVLMRADAAVTARRTIWFRRVRALPPIQMSSVHGLPPSERHGALSSKTLNSQM